MPGAREFALIHDIEADEFNVLIAGDLQGDGMITRDEFFALLDEEPVEGWYELIDHGDDLPLEAVFVGAELPDDAFDAVVPDLSGAGGGSAVSSIVGLHGNTVFDIPERSDKLVAQLKDLLTLAENGQIVSLIFAACERDMGATHAGYVGQINAALIGRGFTMLQRLALTFEETEE